VKNIETKKGWLIGKLKFLISTENSALFYQEFYGSLGIAVVMGLYGGVWAANPPKHLNCLRYSSYGF
jgi:hypothetical protein